MLTYVGLHDAPYVRVKFLDGYWVSSTPQNEIYRYSRAGEVEVIAYMPVPANP